jgi:antirestriction protein ArdC
LKPVARQNASYLTKSERETVAALEFERKVAARHGGWDKVDRSHLRNAARAKADLHRRVEFLCGLDVSKAHRRQRIAALKSVIAGGA